MMNRVDWEGGGKSELSKDVLGRLTFIASFMWNGMVYVKKEYDLISILSDH